MRTVTIVRTIYTVEELAAQCPAAFQAAVQRHAQVEYETADHSDEWGSLEVLDKNVGFNREHRSWLVKGGLGEVADLKGHRAWAWLENALLGPLRLPWTPITAQGKEGQERRANSKYKQRPGTVPDCPFTGFFMDDVLLDSLRSSFLEGRTVFVALQRLEAVVQEIVDDETVVRASEDGFLDWAICNEIEFYEDGSVV